MLSDFRPEVQKGLIDHLKNIGRFDGAKILEIEPGHAKVSIEITEEATNFYGNAHGGFLFSLCDSISGMTAYAYEITNVTQCASFSFLRAVQAGTTIFIEGNTVHKGRKTCVNLMTVTDDEGRMVATGHFTMFFGNPV